MAVTEVYFTVSAKGQRRAWRMSPRQLRAFPMPLAEAELLVATGQATELSGNPFRPDYKPKGSS